VTNNRDDIESYPARNCKNMLESKLKAVLDVNFKTIDHFTGRRPVTQERRPFIRTHLEFKNIGLFNCLDSKGVPRGPYYSKKFGDCTESGIEIEFEANIKRYISLY
jgi:hypothetical protein